MNYIIKKDEIYLVIVILVTLVSLISNFRYILGIFSSFKQLIIILSKIDDVVKTTDDLHLEITNIKNNLKINNLDYRKYIEQIHNKVLMNVGRLRILMKSNLTPQFECDENGKCVWVNQALANLFGVERSDMLNNGWFSYVVPEERNDVAKKWLESVKYDVPYSYQYHLINNKTKEIIYVNVTSITIRDMSGKPLLYCGNIELHE